MMFAGHAPAAKELRLASGNWRTGRTCHITRAERTLSTRAALHGVLMQGEIRLLQIEITKRALR
jgi:hypothetical protein